MIVSNVRNYLRNNGIFSLLLYVELYI